MKKLLPGLLLPLLLFLVTSVHAEDLVLKKIGAMNVNGKYYAHWWYEPTKLTLEGTGSKGANIDITVDGNVQTINASVADGSWKYNHPTDLEKKDHNIDVASGDKKISFILTIGAGSVPADQETKSATLPETGTLLPVLGILALAGMLIYYGFREKKV